MPDNPYDALFDDSTDPVSRVRRIASTVGISPDIADDYLKVTGVESGQNVNVRNSRRGAQGFGQVMPDVKGGTTRTVGGRQFNLRDPDQNIEAGLRYFNEGGNDPVGRRLYYFGGPRARQHYERTGQIPNISDGNLTAAQYVRATGVGVPQQKRQTSDPYDALFAESPKTQVRPAPTPNEYDALFTDSGQNPPPSERQNAQNLQNPPASPAVSPAPSVPNLDALRKFTQQVTARTQQMERQARRKGIKPSQPQTIDYGNAEPAFPQQAPAMSARTPSTWERIKEAVEPYVPGLATLDTPFGIKTDPLRGAVAGVTLGAVGDPREVSREEQIVDPEAQARANLAYGAGNVLGSVVPYVGAETALTKAIPALARATRAASAARTAATFGGVSAARQGVQAARGRPVDLREIPESTALGATMGLISGVDPSIPRRVVAFTAPQVALDIAKGTPKEEAIKNALINTGFALTAGGRGERPLEGRMAELQQAEGSRGAPPETVEPNVLRERKPTFGREQPTQVEQPFTSSRPVVQPQPTAPEVERFRGSENIPLNPTGEAQVQERAAQLKPQLDANTTVFAPDTARNLQSAQPIVEASGAQFEKDPRITDWNHGLQNQVVDKDSIAVRNRYINNPDATPKWRGQEGEPLNDAVDRWKDFWGDVLNRPNKKVVVTNFAGIKGLEALLKGGNGQIGEGFDTAEFKRADGEPAAMYRVTKEGDRFNISEFDPTRDQIGPNDTLLMRHGETEYNRAASVAEPTSAAAETPKVETPPLQTETPNVKETPQPDIPDADNPMVVNGRKAKYLIVNKQDGQIENTYNSDEAVSGGGRHRAYMTPSDVEGLDSGERVQVWMGKNGQLQTDSREGLSPELRQRITEQLQVQPKGIAAEGEGAGTSTETPAPEPPHHSNFQNRRLITTEAGSAGDFTSSRRLKTVEGLPRNIKIEKASKTLYKLYEGNERIGAIVRAQDGWRVADRSDLGIKATPEEAATALVKNKGQAGAIDVDLLTLGVRPFAKDVAARGRAGYEGVKEIGDAIRSVLAPATRGPAARTTAAITRANASEMARAHDIAERSLAGARDYFAKQKPQANYDFIDRVERGQSQSDPKTQKFADTLRDMLDERRDQIRALGTGKLGNFIENYFPHIWKDPEQAKQVFADYAKRPMEGTKSFLRQRTIPFTSEGLARGLEPVSNNPVDLTLLKLREMDKYLMAHKVMGEMRDNGLLKTIKSSERVPEGYQKIDDKVATIFGRSDQGGTLIRGYYVAPEPAAKILNNYLSPGLEATALRTPYRAWRATANLMNQAQLGFSFFHGGFTTLDAAVSRLAAGLEDVFRYGKPLRGAKTIASVPTSPLTNLITGSRMLKEWVAPGSQGADIKQLTDLMVEGGGRAKMDRFYTNNAVQRMKDAFKQGNLILGALRTPAAGIEAATHPVMEWLVPRQKAGVFAEMARREMERLGPNASREQVRQVMAKAWDSVDNRMGQMVYDNLFWNKVGKDLAMASVRSVGWNLGTTREVAGGLTDFATLPVRALQRGRTEPLFTHKMAYAAALPTLVGTMGAMTQYLLTGQGPQELKDYFFPKTGLKDEAGNDERISFPSYMKDIAHAIQEPGKIAASKLHPLITTIGQMLSNKDYFGTKIRNEDDPLIQQLKDEAKFVAKSFIPFSAQAYQREKERGASLSRKLLPFVGITPAPKYINQTPAERLMSKITEEKMPAGSRTREEVARTQMRYQLQAKARKGEDITGDVKAAIQQGILKPDDGKEILRDAKQSPRQLRFKRLGIEDALDVYNRMNNVEQADVKDILAKKASLVDQLPVDRQDAVRERLKGFGLVPNAELRPKRPKREEQPERPTRAARSQPKYVFQ